ncbi:unnamed protein product, partial [Angiostrongylus costaricensis]|uniref:Uncharacterized protein n=1 Tax=Angiostrongylus costaricensis TaxID=334426 RepID=A0A0R3PIM0_ANGCS
MEACLISAKQPTIVGFEPIAPPSSHILCFAHPAKRNGITPQLSKNADESAIRTHAPEGTGALNQRLGPLGHLAELLCLAHPSKSWLTQGEVSEDNISARPSDFLEMESCLILAKQPTIVGFEPIAPPSSHTLCFAHPAKSKNADESGIRTHAPEGTGALNQRLGPLGHLAVLLCLAHPEKSLKPTFQHVLLTFYKWPHAATQQNADESGIRTHALEGTGALNQRLGPFGHLAVLHCLAHPRKTFLIKNADESGIRTHALEGTGALNQRLGPLGHLAVLLSLAHPSKTWL